MSQIGSRSREVIARVGRSRCHFCAPVVASTAATPVATLAPIHPPDIWTNPVTGLTDTRAPISVPPKALVPSKDQTGLSPLEGGFNRERVPLKFQKLESSLANASPARSS